MANCRDGKARSMQANNAARMRGATNCGRFVCGPIDGTAGPETVAVAQPIRAGRFAKDLNAVRQGGQVVTAFLDGGKLRHVGDQQGLQIAAPGNPSSAKRLFRKSMALVLGDFAAPKPRKLVPGSNSSNFSKERCTIPGTRLRHRPVQQNGVDVGQNVARSAPGASRQTRHNDLGWT